MLISDEQGERGGRVVVHGGGLRGKRRHAAKQMSSGEGFSVEVADEAAFKHYVFVNAEEYGLFDRKRRFLQMFVCYQVLTTQWDSRTKRDPSSLKPRYLFLFSDTLFIMKLHDSSDTNARRYRILGRLLLRDLSVEEVGDDMFDVVASSTGALRFAVGSNVTKTQAVASIQEAVRRHQRRVRGGPIQPRADVPVPSDPDDVFEAMNYALAVLEKKLRGTATQEEQWQADVLLQHAMAMQDAQHGPRDAALERENAQAAAVGGADGSLRARLAAKEAQLRATESRAAAAESAVARLRGNNAAPDANQPDLALENRQLRERLDRVRAQSEESERQLRATQQELLVIRRAQSSSTAGDLQYHEGSVDQIISRIQQAPTVSAAGSERTSARAPTADVSRDREAEREADQRFEERQNARDAEEKEREQARQREEEDQRRQKQQEREKLEASAAAEAERERQARFDAKKEQDRVEAERRARQDELDEIEEAKTRTPVAVISNVVAKKGSSSESSSEGLSDESGEFSTMSSDDDEQGQGGDDDMAAFLRQHDLSQIYEKLSDAGMALDRLRIMDVGDIRILPGLDYAQASNLCSALGLKNIHS